jgi:outer membrane protein OmpA-like peptidoglycan-associated protein
MNKILVLITLMLLVFGLNAQESTTYNKWSISADFGNHLISDKFVHATSTFGSIGGDLRYTINPKIGIGLSGGYDLVTLEDMVYDTYDLRYSRLNFESYIDVFNMVDLYSKRFTTLFHGGPGVSYINSIEKRVVPNLRGGFTVLFRITERISLKGDMSVTGNFGPPISINGQSFSDIQQDYPALSGEDNTGVHSMIANSSLGLSISLGKNKKHMDNYTPEPVVPITNTYITNKIDTTINNYFSNNYKTIMIIDTVQYVFFDNDKYEIKISELNSIFKTYVNLDDHPTYTLVIKGLASASNDLTLNADSDEYNMKLSENRANALKEKFVDMGISPDRITIQYYGKDKKFPKESVFDVGRRVELIVNTK